MLLSRRDAIKLGLGLGAAGLAGYGGPAELMASRPRFAQTGGLITKPIPSSGERIPVVGIGTARRYNVGARAAERAPLREVLEAFPDLGGKLIDTAPSYGTAEPVVGDLLAELGNRDRYFLATKVGVRNTLDGPGQIERSFEHLKTEMIDLIQVHNMRDYQNQLAYLRDLKADGRIRYVGITTSSARQHEAFAAMMEAEDGVDVVQVDYSLANRAVEERILPVAADRGMAVLCNLPFGRGLLFDTVGDRPLPEWASEFDGESWAQFFLKYLVSHPAVTCAIPGTATTEYVRDNMGAARGRLPDDALRRRMVEFYDAL
ncbi:MAG: aldo/keto reductase [Gemmatimonadota bacterium]|nr:MAG: aldo/keto reductase [Gemmatimonadota bacterium]